MTQSSYFLTNGSSLEDCHTNFFALADLCGIKWRQYTCDKHYADVNEDPILCSYSKCIGADLLCVWRRVRANNTQEQPNRELPYIDYSKELWIFWYGEEPDFSDLLSIHLTEIESGQGSWESGLTYECRNLLFKALHNLIEKCLISKGYSRLGNWFFLINNSTLSDILRKGVQVTFAFNFFLHGDSTVCVSVDVRHHAALRRITKDDVQLAQQMNGIKVLLSPYGLQGYMTGFVYTDSDQHVQKFLSDWNKTYPLANAKIFKESGIHIPSPFNNHINLSQNTSPNKDDFLNKVIEVIVGDCKMKYPVSYVFITEADSKFSRQKLRYNNDRKGAMRQLEKLYKEEEELLTTNKLAMTPYNNRTPSDVNLLKTRANLIINQCDLSFVDDDDQIDDDSCKDENTNFCESQNKTCSGRNCSCQISHNKTKEKSLEKSKSKQHKHLNLFHHRLPANDADDDNSMLILLSSSQDNGDGVNNNDSVTNPAPIGNNATPIPIMPYKSPVSAGNSSILNTPGIDSSPMSNFNIDASEHVSPLPIVKEEISMVSTPTNNHLTSSPKDKANFGLLSPNFASNECDSNTVKLPDNSGQSNESNNTNLQQSQVVATSEAGQTNGIKRPYRFKGLFESDEHDLRTGLLYDFSWESVNVWDIPAPKNRRKNCETREPESELHRMLLDKDSYDLSEPDEKESRINSNIIFDSKNVLSNQVNGLLADSTTSYNFYSTKQKLLENGDITGKNKFNCHEDDGCDVDYFNSPGDESNGSKNDEPDISRTGCSELGPVELMQMFPTPPSFESNISSPSNVNAEHKCDKNESHNDADKSDRSASPSGPDKYDSTFVYKPPMQSMFLTSNKYAPLENVDCKQILPANCYYKHNSKKQSVKGHTLQSHSPSLSQFPLNPLFNKSKSFPPAPNRSPFTNSMPYRNPRMNGQTMPINSSYLNRMRPPMNMQQPSPMYVGNVIPSDNFNSFRQNSPSLVDGSPMNNYISSPLPNFDNRKSPFPFGQQSLNSPSANITMNNSPMNNFTIQPKMSTSIMAPGMYNYAQNIESNGLIPGFYEANSLMLNLLLSDSMLNLFRDHNFDSCSICVCNMNIKGNDVGIYLPDSPQSQAQSSYDYIQCSCGFSAVSNRHLSQFSGLFFEDEFEITEDFYDPLVSTREKNEIENHYFDKELKKVLSESDENLINMLLSYSTTTFASCSTLARLTYCDNVNSWETFNANMKDNTLQLPERNPLNIVYKDYTEVILQCLSMVRCDPNSTPKPGMLMPAHNVSRGVTMRQVLHHWPFRRSSFPVNSQQVMLMLKTLQPLMQESVQRKGSGNEVTYNTVKGPLTWRQFHRLAGRGTECQCEPQPIPTLLVGYDKDCVTMSPFGLKQWQHMQVEPYAITRDVHYVVISPSNKFIVDGVRDYFKELTCVYESCRLGRHSPLTKLAPDGICLLTNTEKSDANRQLDDWFNQIGDSILANKIRAYARALFNLISHLNVSDRSLFENNHSIKQENVSIYNSSANNNTSVTMNGNLQSSFTSNNSIQNCQTYTSMSQQKQVNNYGQINSTDVQSERMPNEMDSHNFSHDSNNQPSSVFQLYEDEEEQHKQPSVIIYIVEPFSALGKEATKLGAVGLFKSFLRIKQQIRLEKMKNNIHLQILSINSILSDDKDFRGNSRYAQLKELSFSSFSLCKYHLSAQPSIKSLTGLGPAASFKLFLQSKQANYNVTELLTTPYILAPMKDKQTELGEMFGDRTERSQILYCCYCLSEDQRWLIASCTNDKGDILQTQIINMNIPNRTRRRNASVRRFALEKLMKFVQAVMSESVLPWRLVIGRLGRIGHGELKDWTCLLSKKSLLKYSRQLRDMCEQCNHLCSQDQPAIYSACLISLEADTSLRVFPNFYTPDERFSSSCNTCSLSTPEDASCTHILVFPTSATTQSSHTNCMDNLGAIADDFFSNFQVDDQDIQEDGMDGIFDNLFINDDIPDGPHPDSPSNRQSFDSKTAGLLEEPDEPSQLLQQPLALAFYVSTVRTGPLPKWFWANCPHLEHNCPTFLKSALLIHTPFVQQNTDDLLHSNNRDCHPLDSNLTTDVLRYTLEGYNSLSWLILDPATSDRLSCLPVHIQALMQLYHSVHALI